MKISKLLITVAGTALYFSLTAGCPYPTQKDNDAIPDSSLSIDTTLAQEKNSTATNSNLETITKPTQENKDGAIPDSSSGLTQENNDDCSYKSHNRTGYVMFVENNQDNSIRIHQYTYASNRKLLERDEGGINITAIVTSEPIVEHLLEGLKPGEKYLINIMRTRLYRDTYESGIYDGHIKLSVKANQRSVLIVDNRMNCTLDRIVLFTPNSKNPQSPTRVIINLATPENKDLRETVQKDVRNIQEYYFTEYDQQVARWKK